MNSIIFVVSFALILCWSSFQAVRIVVVRLKLVVLGVLKDEVLKMKMTVMLRAGKGVAAYVRRQMKDPFCRQAREHEYRARSAFKLTEIDDKHRFLRPGCVVLDVGAAPGSWTQVAVERVDPERTGGSVIAIDLQAMMPIPGALLLPERDIRDASSHSEIAKLLAGRSVDCLLSDMAPSPTGDSSTDHTRILSLCRSLLASFLQEEKKLLRLSNRAIFLCKIWDGSEKNEFLSFLSTKFASVRTVKPLASRDSSSELFILSRDPLHVK